MLIVKCLLHLRHACRGDEGEKDTYLKLSSSCYRLTDTQECLESSLIEKEHTLAKTSEKLELIDSLREALHVKEEQHKEVSDRLLQTEHNVKIFLFCICS